MWAGSSPIIHTHTYQQPPTPTPTPQRTQITHAWSKRTVCECITAENDSRLLLPFRAIVNDVRLLSYYIVYLNEPYSQVACKSFDSKHSTYRERSYVAKHGFSLFIICFCSYSKKLFVTDKSHRLIPLIFCFLRYFLRIFHQRK